MLADDGFRRQLLRDSEATLRQVRGVLNGLADAEGPDARRLQGQIEDSSERAAEVAGLVVATHAEIRSVLDVLRHGRRRLRAPTTDASVETEIGDVRNPADVLLGDVELRIQRLYHRVSLGLEPGETESSLADSGVR